MAMLPAVGIDTTTPAVVLKFDQNVMHHGGLGAIRSLGRLGVPVYGVHGDQGPGGHLSLFAGPVDLAPRCGGRGTHPRRAAHLGGADRTSCRAHPDRRCRCHLPRRARHLVAATFLFPAPPADLPRRVAGKFSMHAICGGAGVPCPSVTVPASLGEAHDFAAGAAIPSSPSSRLHGVHPAPDSAARPSSMPPTNSPCYGGHVNSPALA